MRPSLPLRHIMAARHLIACFPGSFFAVFPLFYGKDADLPWWSVVLSVDCQGMVGATMSGFIRSYDFSTTLLSRHTFPFDNIWTNTLGSIRSLFLLPAVLKSHRDTCGREKGTKIHYHQRAPKLPVWTG
ncbi:hypothetical protein CPLU01_11118 [Colletotrichum plurivorum]|uniref:Uncharacterized protein n=1 Tax=Colletotrichum plurivorum TaxID=2175906 RepID=A0A8H6N946_9PEZI|nr:hypothetical protein CPLU01_11118 [Colletotrichum plurivorum]